MNTATHQAPPGGGNTRQLWAAVAVLGIAVVALGASLVHIQTRPVDGHMALAALDPPTASTQESTVVAPATPLPVSTVGPDETVLATPAPARTAKAAPPATVRKSPSTPVTRAPAAPTAAPRVSAPAMLPVPAAVVLGTQSNAPMVMSEAGLLASRPLATPVRAVCATCGRVESVTAIERKGGAQGVGGMAGNSVEKNVPRTAVYQVQVRMEDGSLRFVEQSNAPAIGSAVIIDGQQIQPADGAASVSQGHASVPAFVPQATVYSSERN